MAPRPPCSVAGCDKLVRSRGLCIGHGGGKRCAHEGCNASAEGREPFCLEHGGESYATACFASFISFALQNCIILVSLQVDARDQSAKKKAALISRGMDHLSAQGMEGVPSVV